MQAPSAVRMGLHVKRTTWAGAVVAGARIRMRLRGALCLPARAHLRIPSPGYMASLRLRGSFGRSRARDIRRASAHAGIQRGFAACELGRADAEQLCRRREQLRSCPRSSTWKPATQTQRALPCPLPARRSCSIFPIATGSRLSRRAASTKANLLRPRVPPLLETHKAEALPKDGLRFGSIGLSVPGVLLISFRHPLPAAFRQR